MEMISWQPSCNFLKRLNVITVNSENCVEREKNIFWLSFIQYKDVFFKNYDLKS